MAPVQRLWRLAWGGSLFTDEQWACSLHLHSASPPAITAAIFKAPLQAWMNSTGSLISNAASLEYVKFNEISPLTGRYILPTSDTALVTPPDFGTVGTSPAQLSLSVGITTVLARGRGHAGRFYPPTGSTGSALDAQGREPASKTLGMAGAAVALINAINAAAAPAVVVVFSSIGQSVEVVTGVRVGRVWDTMRSRRSSIGEDYSLAPLA